MARKNYSMLPVLAAIVMIPQFLFWWLAPAAAAARLAVYIGGTILTVGIPVACLLAYWYSSLRRAAGLAVVCGVLEAAVVALSALLLGVNASVKSAVFSLIITTLVCLIVLIPLISATLHPQRQGVYSAAISAEPVVQPMHSPQSCSSLPPMGQPHSAAPSHPARPVSAGTPLPPRNR